MKDSVYIIHGKELDGYKYPEGCPFNSSRAGRACKILASIGLFSGDGHEIIAPVPANREDLESFHTSRYLDALVRASRGSIDAEFLVMGLGSPDCPLFPDIYNYPVWGVGASLTAARMILDGKARSVFNPSGGFHHAGSEYASGFCYLNDIVLACMMLTRASMKVMFIDIDVHHCDGVQDAFYDRNDVLTLSFHESGETLFPGTGYVGEIGKDKGMGYSVNVPLPVHTYDDAYIEAFKSIALPLVSAYNPDVIVLEAGMDALAGDPLAHLNLTNNAYADVVKLLKGTSRPLLVTGGGGYNVANTARGWALIWSILTGDDYSDDAMLGMGGVMMQSSEWRGGLRDRILVPDDRVRQKVDFVIKQITNEVKALVFPFHGI